ncbi:low molecular weight phosphatase family protein [Parvibaculum sp.]|uniref:arsenate-mycothiol transferase ArsC n=1 Tax=Parvibaculum sp. TaxID=2024848 RepID=UPI003BAD7C72
MSGGSAEVKRGDAIPASVLFVCNLNAIRSPIAEALLKKSHGARIFIDSAGISPAEDADPFAAEVLREAGVDDAPRTPKSIGELDDVTSFDLIVALTPEAREKVEALTRSSATDVEYWEVADPLAAPTGGNRERRLDAYRALRDELAKLLERRFGRAGAATG